MSSSFILGGISVEIRAALDLRQSYSELGGRFRRRKMSGTLRTQHHWSKISTTLNGLGWIPNGLAGLDYSVNMTLSCAATRSIAGAYTGITIPADRRTDSGFTAYGLALIDNVAEYVEPTSIISNIMVLPVVSGATQYQAVYYPEITVQADMPKESYNESSGEWSWSFTAEEV